MTLPRISEPAATDREWRFIATGETIEARGRQARGLELPEAVLRKIFRENAVKALPGVLG